MPCAYGCDYIEIPTWYVTSTVSVEGYGPPETQASDSLSTSLQPASILEEILKLLREQRAVSDSSTAVDSATNQHSCASGGPVSTWAVDGTARTIVPPVGFPTRESEHLPGSPYKWTYAGGPTPGRKPETFLRNRRRDQSQEARLKPEVDAVRPNGKPKPEPGRFSREQEGNSEVDPVRRRSPTVREIPAPDGNPRLRRTGEPIRKRRTRIL
ncbi:hypothetical protein NP493_60g03003 [Ridgeia piscesae]|uniref:Uncharacterized protein n=1 Tax=Ridgeia piscesae TaxID=27915 RepID=A0AAD9UJ18_RIDPI|nr:hypothetical protein NP493_60g03003 [Ridgeia piscesae]